jgi:FkbM family methyltransferase
MKKYILRIRELFSQIVVLKIFIKSPYSGLNKLDKKIEEYVNYDGGYFVELGANDGVTQSNTLYLERHRGWKGVLVEPTPHNFLKCLSNRSSLNYISCNACVPFNHPEKFVEIIFSNLMSTPVGLESDIKNPEQNAKDGLRWLKPKHVNFSFGALAKPLNDILIDASAPRLIDLLSLDVEGAEIAVLKGINHLHFRFKYIVVECRNVQALISYMNSIDYDYVAKLSHHDILFKTRV